MSQTSMCSKQPPESTLGVWVMWMTSLLLVLSGCGGCAKNQEQSPPRQEKTASDAAGSAASEVPSLPGLKWSLIIGDEDSANRYPATVIVMVHDAKDASKHQECSGVLIAPRLVLTAGHCVCQRRAAALPDDGTILLDGSQCAATALVFLVTTDAPSADRPRAGWSERLSGTVRPHPRFRVLLDSQGNVTSSTANLALVLLEEPVRKHIPPVRLSEEEAKVGERLTVVGFGYIEGLGALDGRRRFSQEAVTGILDGEERVLFGSPELHSYRGDTGGPCLREESGAPALVGISSRGLGREPAFTSISAYREWLEQEIQLASSLKDAPAP